MVDKRIALDIYDSLYKLMGQLYERWVDEHEYEDINDYAEYIRPYIEYKGEAKILKMIKKPFGFKIAVQEAIYQFKVTKNSYEYKRIK